MAGRLPVAKTYKLFIDGAFPRSESGRTFPVHGPDGTLLANAARASRKDLRDAVRTARAAQEGWAARPPTTAVRFSTGWPRCSRADGPSWPPC